MGGGEVTSVGDERRVVRAGGRGEGYVPGGGGVQRGRDLLGIFLQLLLGGEEYSSSIMHL